MASRPATVQQRWSGPWRAAGAVLLVATSVAAGLWIYDLGQRFAGADSAAARQERTALRERVAVLEADLARLRALSDSSDSRLQVEKTAQGQLAQQVKVLETENVKLKEELAFFETLMPGNRDERLSIYRFRVDPSGVPGEYRYRLLVTAPGGKDARDFNGRLQLVVNVVRDQKTQVITLPAGREPGDPYRLSFKRVQRIEGLFRVDAESRVTTVQARVLENGSEQPRATENFTLSTGSPVLGSL